MRAAALVIVLLTAAQARADETRDWMLDAQAPGTFLNTDLVLPGAQLQLERRDPLLAGDGELDLRLGTMPLLFQWESQLAADVRYLCFGLGGSFGTRYVFDHYHVEPGAAFDREARAAIDRAGRSGSAFEWYAEGRLTLSLPLDKHVFLESDHALRAEVGKDRSYDWLLGVMRDAGLLYRSDNFLLYRHAGFGAIGPAAQVLNFALSGRRNTQLNLGLTFMTRPGLFHPTHELLYLNVLLGVLGRTNGEPVYRVYGDHVVNLPLVISLVYRLTFSLAHS